MEIFQKIGIMMYLESFMVCKGKNVSLQKFSLTLKILV